MNNNKEKAFRIFSLVSVVVVLIIYTLSIIFALMGNIGLTITIFAFNSVFVVVLYFIIRFNKNKMLDEVSENEDDENKEG